MSLGSKGKVLKRTKALKMKDEEIKRCRLAVAVVGILKTIDNDIRVLLKAYTTLKSDAHAYLLIQNHDLILSLLYWMSSSS
nr:hypothetical protein CFP56_23194 [Quercus suber]